MPIRWRLTLFIALVIGAILIVLGLALYFLSRGALYANIEDTARSRAEAVARTVEAGEGLNDDDIEEFTLDGVFVAIRDGNGGVLSEVNFPAGGDTAVWRRAISSEEAASGAARLSGDDETYYVHAVPVDPPDGPARVVEAGKSYEPAAEILEVFGTVLVVGIGAAFILSIGGAYLLAGASLRPMGDVTDAAREMERTTSRSGCRWPTRKTRSGVSQPRSTASSRASKPPSPAGRKPWTASGASPPMPATSCARRSPR